MTVGKKEDICASGRGQVRMEDRGCKNRNPDVWPLGWSEKNFLFQINFPGVKKVGIWSKNMFKSGFAWLHAKMAVLPLSSGLSDPNFAKFVISS